jgi:WD40 repeat protein
VYKNIARAFVAVVAGVTLSGAGWTSHGPAGPGTRLWVARYNGPHNSEDGVTSMAVSPDGKTVFVTGTSEKAGAGAGPGDIATVAYRAATGRQLWVARYNGPGVSFDQATSVAVSPDGATVFVTGSSSTSQGAPGDYATVAYNAATGRQLWVARDSGPGNRSGSATSVAVSPDGATVFVTGYSDRLQGDRADDYATIAYQAATGARLWVKRYNGPGNLDDGAFSVAVSPGGGRVFVTGSSGGDYATVAYQAATGAQLWVMRYNGPSNPEDGAGGISVAVSPGGRTVFVTGTSSKPHSAAGYATIAYRAATGAQLWATRYNAPGNGSSRATWLAVSPDGSKVFVTGASGGDYGTVGYSAATGTQLWAARYNGPGNLDDYATAVAVSPDGSQVFVTGPSTGAARHYEFATIAYGAVTGGQLWAARYNGTSNLGGGSRAMAVSPDGSRVFVAGSSAGTTTHADYTTIAYRG